MVKASEFLIIPPPSLLSILDLKVGRMGKPS
jgi:hypothetical protein